MRPLCQRLQRPLCQRLQRRGFNGDGRSTERPYSRYSSCRTTTDAQIVRPYNRYTSRCSGTDARPSVPTTVTRLALTSNPLVSSLFFVSLPYNIFEWWCISSSAERCKREVQCESGTVPATVIPLFHRAYHKSRMSHCPTCLLYTSPSPRDRG